jgi:hypothetical protein
MRKRIIVLVMAALEVEIRLKNDFKNASIYSFMAISILVRAKCVRQRLALHTLVENVVSI